MINKILDLSLIIGLLVMVIYVLGGIKESKKLAFTLFKSVVNEIKRIISFFKDDKIMKLGALFLSLAVVFLTIEMFFNLCKDYMLIWQKVIIIIISVLLCVTIIVISMCVYVIILYYMYMLMSLYSKTKIELLKRILNVIISGDIAVLVCELYRCLHSINVSYYIYVVYIGVVCIFLLYLLVEMCHYSFINRIKNNNGVSFTVVLSIMLPLLLIINLILLTFSFQELGYLHFRNVEYLTIFEITGYVLCTFLNCSVYQLDAVGLFTNAYSFIIVGLGIICMSIYISIIMSHVISVPNQNNRVLARKNLTKR